MFNARVLDLRSREEIKQEMKKIGATAPGIQIMLKKADSRLVKVEGVGTKEANIIKQEMLSAGGDAATDKGTLDHSVEESDLILMGTTSQYEKLLSKLNIQPFQCKQIAAEVEEVLENFEKRDFVLKLPKKKIPLDRTLVMGVLNVTPDSFSDGGKFLEPDTAINHGEEMAKQGADIIDIGGESTRPYSDPVSQEEELKRVRPVVEELLQRIDVPISIDTMHPEVAKEIVEMGAQMVNDVSGLRDEQMMSTVAELDVPVVIMHMLGEPKTMQEKPEYKDVMGDICRYLRNQVDAAVKGGISREKIIVDPGIGFGKTVEHNLEIVRRLGEMRSLGFPILIGASRKSFIGKILDADETERMEGSLAAMVSSIQNGANIVRVHDVKESVRAVKIADAVHS
ncbi:MAG: dihydropteroate synthase [Methanobacteriota archaeon]|nr:MAG: dihydropteroate synthase [Euryarchaeota archaeon]